MTDRLKMLAQMRADFAARGWNPDDLRNFRMEDPAAEPDPNGELLPLDLEVDDDALLALEADLLAQFDAADEAHDITLMAQLADQIEAVNAEQGAREQRAVEAEAEAQRQRDRVNALRAQEPDPEADPEADPEDPAAEPEAEPVAAQPEPVAAAAVAPTRRTASPPRGRTGRPPSAAAVRNAAGRPAVPAPRGANGQITLTAAADVPGYSNGQVLPGLEDVARAMHARARGLPIKHSGDTSGGAMVASIDLPVADDDIITEHSTRDDIDRILTAAGIGAPSNSLVAAGGYCAPTVPIFDLFRLDDADQLLTLPEVTVTRGGVNLPDFIDVSAGLGALWTWTEAQDIAAVSNVRVTNKAISTNVATLTTNEAHNLAAGDIVTVTGVDATFNGTYTVLASGLTATQFSYNKVAGNVGPLAATGYVVNQTPEPTKPCIRIPCPGFTETLQEVEGLCVTHGNLTDRAWPELTTAFLGIVANLHLHRLSNAALAKVIAMATATTPTATTSDVAGDVLHAIEFQANDIRARYLMGRSSRVDMIFPAWAPSVIRSTMAMRNGVPPDQAMAVTDEEIAAWMRVRGVAPQYVLGYQPLQAFAAGGAPTAAYPTTLKFLAMPAGSVFRGVGPRIDLGVVRDSVLNATNDYTAAFTEQAYLVARRGPAPREVTLTIGAPDGVTGGP